MVHPLWLIHWYFSLQVEVRGNDSRIHAEMSFGSNITFIILNNLTMGRSYLVRVCAFTSAGSGPFGPPLTVTMDGLGLESGQAGGIGGGVSTENGSSEILKEVWFIILMGFLLFIFLLLLIIILYSRRKSHGKKDHISSKAIITKLHYIHDTIQVQELLVDCTNWLGIILTPKTVLSRRHLIIVIEGEPSLDSKLILSP